MKEYALYKGDNCLSIGTIKEIAQDLKVSKETILFYKTESYKKRLSKRNVKNARELVELEEDDEE